MAKAYVMGRIEFNANHWTRTFRIDELPVVARVRQKEQLSRDITIRLEAPVELSEKQQEELIDKVRYEIGADDTLDALREIQDKDILTKLALKNSAGLRLYANSDTIEAAISAIIQQNVDFFKYQQIQKDFVTKYGDPIPWDDSLYLYPELAKIAEMTVSDWKDLGLGLKAEYLGLMTERDLKNIEIYAYYPVYERGMEGLMMIDGIGRYTARVIMIYAARRYEKAILDSYVQEILDHKYKLHQVLPLSEYDRWIANLWPKDPALVLHAHIQDYLPAYIRSFDFTELD